MRSLRGRLTLGITLVLAVAIAGAGVLVSRYYARSERDAFDDSLKRVAALSLDTSVDTLQEGLPPRDSRLNKALSTNQITLRLVVGDRVLTTTGRPLPAGVTPAPIGSRTLTVGGRSYRSYTTEVVELELGELARLEVTSPLAVVERKRARLNRRLAAFGLAALLIAGCGTWFAATLLLAPLRRLRAAASRIVGTEDLSRRLPGDDGPAEVRSLAASFNDMLARLARSAADRERAFAATRRFTADAGHELRTPLTSVQATLSALSRHPNIPAAQRTELVNDALSEHRRLVDLLDGLQAMARGDASPGELADVELGDVVAASLDQASSRHPSVTWAAALPDDPVVVRGWEPGLRLLVDNLLENAARHGRPAGTVRVSVQGGPTVALVVDDDGPGIVEADRERIFEPFERVDGTDAPGSGLGLALVRQQARAHDARIEVGESPAGGARFEVRFT